jgi:Putative mono-oxygenase ydhR
MPILLINFKLNVFSAEYRKIAESVVQAIADVPGLVWKVWLLNEQDREAGGIYLFQDEQSLAAYLSGPIIRQIKGVVRNQREEVRDNAGINSRYSRSGSRAGNYLAGDSLRFMAPASGVLKGGF